PLAALHGAVAPHEGRGVGVGPAGGRQGRVLAAEGGGGLEAVAAGGVGGLLRRHAVDAVDAADGANAAEAAGPDGAARAAVRAGLRRQGGGGQEVGRGGARRGAGQEAERQEAQEGQGGV